MEEQRSDEQIVEHVLAGERNEFEILIERHQSAVLAVVARHVPYSAVLEVGHEAFVDAYRSLKGFKGGSFRNWLLRIAVRRAYDFWRERYRRKEDKFSELSQEGQKLLEQVIREDARVAFESEEERAAAQEIAEFALQKLSPAERMVLTLVYFDEYPLSEVAKILGWTLVTTKVRVHRARKKLRSVIEKMA